MTELPVDPARTAADCRDGCQHRRACRVADRRRADSGHPVTVVPRPKMDAQTAVAAVCGCGRYTSNPSSVHGALASWRQHADDTLAASVDGIRPHLPRTAEEAEQARQVLLALPPISREQLERLGGNLDGEGVISVTNPTPAPPPPNPRPEPGSVK